MIMCAVLMSVGFLMYLFINDISPKRLLLLLKCNGVLTLCCYLGNRMVDISYVKRL